MVLPSVYALAQHEGRVTEHAMKPAIAYIRVSTQRQGKSGLGLEAQQALIRRFADQEGFEIVQTFTEVQSGKDDDDRQPQRGIAV